MSLTTIDKQNIKSMLDTSIKAGIAHLPTVEVLRGIVEEEIGESLISGPLKVALTRLEEKIDSGVYKIEIMYEGTRSDIKAMAEMLSDNLKVKDKVADHEYRLIDIENMQPMMIKTLKTHSKKLNTLYE